jgi:hypothetical protein
MYAALMPEIINPTMDPKAQKNIFRSPSFSPETARAFRKQSTAAVSANVEIEPKAMKRIRSKFIGFALRFQIYEKSGLFAWMPACILPLSVSFAIFKNEKEPRSTLLFSFHRGAEEIMPDPEPKWWPCVSSASCVQFVLSEKEADATLRIGGI